MEKKKFRRLEPPKSSFRLPSGAEIDCRPRRIPAFKKDWCTIAGLRNKVFVIVKNKRGRGVWKTFVPDRSWGWEYWIIFSILFVVSMAFVIMSMVVLLVIIDF